MNKLAWLALLAAGCNDPLFCPDLYPPAPAASVAPVVVPPPPAPPEPPPPPPEVLVTDEWIPIPAAYPDRPHYLTDRVYLNGEVCRSINTTCAGKHQPPPAPCRGYDEGWTKVLTREEVFCVIAAQKIDPEYYEESRHGSDYSLHRKRAERAAWIQSCTAAFECQ
jgi:hypothetical protein